jgi:predicted nucleic acid-binding protein
MLIYMLDTDTCIYVMKNYPRGLREKFNALAEQLCLSSITLGELQYGAEKSARRAENLTADHFVARPSETRRLRIMDKRVRNWSERERPVVRTTCRSAVMRAAKD